MKYRVFAAICILICCLTCGCSFWMDGEYLSVTPHEEELLHVSTDVVEVTDYLQLRNALAELVESGAESGTVSAPLFTNTIAQHYVNVAVNYVMEFNPIASYAVNEITYEVGANTGKTTISFHIAYQHSRAEILQIKQPGSMGEAEAVITSAVGNFGESVVLRVRNYSDMNIAQLVQDYAYANPDRVMEIPKIHTMIYPDEGTDRVIALEFTYETNRDDLKEMQEQVEEVFTSAELYVKKTAQVTDIYSRLYSFLMERNDYTIQSSITPAYSLLHYGVGDSRAFANVYAAMCRRAELDCKVLNGTRDGEQWCWNVVRFRGKYYHVDLLSCLENGEFYMCEPSELVGYTWDDSSTPWE